MTDSAARGLRSRLVPGVALLVGLVLALTLVTTAPSEADRDGRTASGQGSRGIGDPYWPLDGNGGFDVQHYDVRVRYGFASGKLAGRTVITAVATQNLRRFNLDLLLGVRRVSVDGRRAAARKQGKHELLVRPATAIAAGTTFRVVVDYAGTPGAFRYAGESNWLADRHEVVAMNEPHMAPWWFPANDHPSDKATISVTATVPRGNQVVSGGRLLAKRHTARTATYRWGGAGPMSTYLAYFAAGRFRVERGTLAGRPWLIAVSRRLSARQQRDGLRVLRRSPRDVRWLEARLGDYPFATTGGLMTSLPVNFALENQTRPTYPQMGDSAYSRSTVVHELAHQWFGDSVAVHRWSDIWLNEGAATFMELVYAETHGGIRAQQQLEETYTLNRGSKSYWKLRLSAPGAANIFSSAIYERGALVFQALRHRLGDDVFWPMIRGYLQTNRNGNASIPQFRAFAQQRTGVDLTGFFAAWLDGTTRPAHTAANGF